MNKPLAAVKYSWNKNKGTVAIAALATLAAGAYVYKIHVRDTNAFLKEHGLYDLFYTLNE